MFKAGAVVREVETSAGTGATAGHWAAVGTAPLQLSPLLGGTLQAPIWAQVALV